LVACDEEFCVRDSRAVIDALVPALIFYHWYRPAHCSRGHLGEPAPTVNYGFRIVRKIKTNRARVLGSHPWHCSGRLRAVTEPPSLFAFKETPHRSGRELYYIGDLRVTVPVPVFWNPNPTEFSDMAKVGFLLISGERCREIITRP
jgi:hypothetical protein